MTTEEWRDIPSLPGFQASSLGRIRRTVIGRNGQLPNILKPWNHNGYRRFQINVYGDRPFYFVHVLVCEAFHGPKPAWAEEVRHLDGTRTNDTPDNLRWGTRVENAADRRLHGRDFIGVGVDNLKAKIDDQTVVEIFRMRSRGMTGSEIGQIVGLSRHTVVKILARKTWRHVPIPLMARQPKVLAMFGGG